MITVDSTDTVLRVTIPKDAVSPEQFNAFVNWLRLEEITRHSRLTEADADRLADDIKSEWWAANKDRFIPPSEQ